jgi:hypothetical protein
MPTTIDRVRAWLADSPLLSDGDFAHFAAQANADPDEGADWLPAYKVSLGVLMTAFGEVMATAGELATAAEAVAPGRTAVCRRVLRQAELLARLSLRPCGIGPDESPGRAAAVDAKIDADWPLPEARR